MNRIPMTPFLRNVLRVDAVLSALTALAMLADAEPLAGLLGVPAPALRIVGLALLPWVAYLAWLSRLPQAPHGAVWAVVAGNALWVVDCAALALGLGAQPTGPGQALLAVQCAGTLVLAELQWLGLKRARQAFAAA